MSLAKCDNCGAVLAAGPDGRYAPCAYCKAGTSGAIDAGALAATLGRELADAHAFAEHLATTLAAAFPEHVVVEKSGLFSKHVSKVEITLKQMIYRLQIDGKAITAHRTRAVHGIALKSESLTVPEWLKELSHALSAFAAESQAAHQALSSAIR
jgi:hypothetical protein